MQKYVLVLALLLLTWPPLGHAKSSLKKVTRYNKYTDRACGYSFEYPATLRIKPIERQGCDVTLEFQERKRVKGNAVWKTAHILEIHAFESAFEAGAQDDGFELEQTGEWVAIGRQGAKVPAEQLNNSHWQGLRAQPPVGCFDGPNGTYSGLDEMDSVFLNDRNGHSLSLYSGECPSDPLIIDLILPSIRFIRREPLAR